MNSFFIVCCLKCARCFSIVWKKFKFCCNKALLGLPGKIYGKISKFVKYVAKRLGFFVIEDG